MLSSLDQVKAWLSLSNNTDDALLMRLIGAASAFIETYLGRSIACRDYREIINGNGKPILLLANYPVRAVTQVLVDGRSLPATTALGLPGYRFDDLSLFLAGEIFRRGHQNVEICYQAGYAQTPPDIEQACIELVALRYRERERIGHQSKSLAGETVSFFIGDMPASVKTLLAPYRKVAAR